MNSQDRLFRKWGRFWGKPPPERRRAVRCYFKRAWNRMLPGVPLPVRLPWGGWWLAYGDWLDDVVFTMGAEDDACRRALEQLLQPGMVVFDLGAHHGFYTLLASKKVGPQGVVVAFEPSPRELKRLHQHLLLNRCSNVRVEPLAVGSYSGVAELFLVQGRGTTLNSLREPLTSSPVLVISVPITTLDEYMDRYSEGVDVIKIDVEGAEIEVLQGAEKLLGRRPRPLVMCEFVDACTERFGYETERIHCTLRDNGYFWFKATAQGRLRPAGSPSRRAPTAYSLFAVPEERLEMIANLVDRERVAG